MKDLVIHRSGMEIDLQAPGPDGQRVLEAIHEGGAERGELCCRKHGGHLYLKRVKGVMYGCHWPGTAGDLTPHTVALMSEEHRIQVDYLARAAEREGLPTITEHSLPTHVRPDLIVNGHTAFEVQRSRITPRDAKARTTKAVRGGMKMSMWISDWPADRPPQWLGLIPSARIYAPTWTQLPRPGSAAVQDGLSTFARERWYGGHDKRCIRDDLGRCTAWRFRREPLIGVSLDHLCVGLAVGEYVPVDAAGNTHIVETALANRLGLTWGPPIARERNTSEESDRLECVSPVPARARRGICLYDECGAEARLYPGGWLCARHAPGVRRLVLPTWPPPGVTWVQEPLPEVLA